MSRTVRYTPAAEADLDEIWLTIALESEKTADRVVDAIYERARQLATFPSLGPGRPDLAEDMRVLVEGSYLVLYRLADEAVEIVRIIHGARDLTTLF